MLLDGYRSDKQPPRQDGGSEGASDPVHAVTHGRRDHRPPQLRPPEGVDDLER